MSLLSRRELSPLSRRTFLKSTAVLAGATAFSARSWAQVAGANGEIRVAVVGLNGRGRNHLSSLAKVAGVRVVALCDADTAVLAKVKPTVNGGDVRTYVDLRELLAQKDIDAITIATPNHLHSLQAVWACQAGKDVYVEKPVSHNIWEGRQLVAAAAKYNRIVQHGVQLRSSVAIREAVEHLRNGLIGRVYMSRGLVFRRRGDIGNQGVSAIPKGLNYDLWCGPAPMRPFSKNLVHYNWHWHWNYGNGDVGNQGIHETDLCMWGLGIEELPEHITSMGGKFLWDDCKEVPEVQTSIYHYPKQKKIIQFS